MKRKNLLKFLVIGSILFLILYFFYQKDKIILNKGFLRKRLEKYMIDTLSRSNISPDNDDIYLELVYLSTQLA